METAAWLSAIATMLAVLVALFKEEIIGLWRKPILDASIKLSAPDCHMTIMTISNTQTNEVIAQGKSFYFRLWVKNQGNLRADKVQVFASKLQRKHADGEFKTEEQFLPMNLKWSHSQTSINPEIFAEGISPGMGKHCDLAHILEPEIRNKMTFIEVDRELTVLELDLEVVPNTQSNILKPGTYRLELKIAAANAKPITKTLEINLTGKWFINEDNMFSDGIGIREVK